MYFLNIIFYCLSRIKQFCLYKCVLIYFITKSKKDIYGIIQQTHKINRLYLIIIFSNPLSTDMLWPFHHTTLSWLYNLNIWHMENHYIFGCFQWKLRSTLYQINNFPFSLSVKDIFVYLWESVFSFWMKKHLKIYPFPSLKILCSSSPTSCYFI